MSIPLDRIAEEANREIQIRVDKESSMLHGEERAAAGNAIKRIIDRYQGALRERGGYQNILQEMNTYLATKTGDPLSLTDPEHRQGLDPYRTALRCLLDPEEPGKPGRVKSAAFENLLNPEARSYTIEYSNDKPRMELRELLAYYWLAASDPNMSLSEEQLADVPGDISDQEKRNILIEGEKENLIIKIQEIRRAHNGDPQCHSETSMIDEPSCGPGTFGRIVSSPLYNPIGKLQVNPSAGFPWNIEAFIFKKFQEAGKEAIDGYQSYLEKYLLFSDPEETPQFIRASEKYKEFLEEIAKSKKTLLKELKKEYGDALTPERREYAEKLYEEICNGLDLSNPSARPRQTLVNRMNESAEKLKKKEILEATTEIMKPKYTEHYNKVSEGLIALTEQLMSYDFEHVTNSDLTKNKADMIQRYNDIIKSKELGSSKVSEEYQNLYKKKLEEEGLSFLPDEITRIGLSELDNGSKQHSKLDKIRSEFDSKYAEYLAKEKVEREKRIQKILEKFEKNGFIHDLNSVNTEVKNEMLHMQQAIDKIHSNLIITGFDLHEKNILQRSEKITEISKNVNLAFLDLLYKEGLSPSPEEMDEINQKLQKLLNIKQNKEQMSQAQSKLNELKKIKSVHDNYQEILQTAKYETYKLALSLYNKVNEHALELIETEPKKNSLEEKQLSELMLARTQLKDYIQDPHAHKELKISKVIEKAENLNKIVARMQQNFDIIGYPGKFKRFIDSAKNHGAKLLNWMFKVKIKTKKSVKKHETQEILALTKLFDISRIKNTAKEIEKPKYAISNKNIILENEKIIVAEGQIKEVDRNKDIIYPEISSCLTITALLSDGTKIASHLVMTPGPTTEHKAQDAIEDITKLIGTRKVKHIIIAAGSDLWATDANKTRLLDFDDIASGKKMHVGLDAIRSTCEVKLKCNNISTDKNFSAGNYIINTNDDGTINLKVESTSAQAKRSLSL
jgi:hypothetical protein